MKILFFISSISQRSGGPSRSVPMLAKGLAETGVDMTLMTPYSDDMNTHALDGTAVKLVVLKKGFCTEEVESHLCREQYDLVQIQSLWENAYRLVARLCRKHHIPYMITPRGMLEPWSLQQKAWKKKLALLLYQRKDLNHAACIYTTSVMEAQHVKALGIKAPCSVIPNGIETKAYPCRINSEKVQKQILFLSRIHMQKGIELLIDAWSHLQSDFPDWKVKIVGNGEEAFINQLKSRIAAVGLHNCMEILPPVFGKAKVELYQSSSLFVLPTFSENFGMVIAEAMACGVPVLTTTNTPWEILNEKQLGWCIPLSEEKLVQQLRLSLTIPSDELFQMGQNAALYIREHFDYRKVAAKTLKLYSWIIDDGEKPGFVYE